MKTIWIELQIRGLWETWKTADRYSVTVSNLKEALSECKDQNYRLVINEQDITQRAAEILKHSNPQAEMIRVLKDVV